MEEEENFRSTKTGLRKLLRDPDTVLPVLTDAVFRTHEIVTRGWFFLKLYMLTVPDVRVTRTLMEVVLKVVSRAERQRPFTSNAVLMSQLQELYRTTFQPLLPPGDVVPSRKGLKQVLSYEAKKMVTAFETHLKCHYVSYVDDACGEVYMRRKLRKQYKGKAYEPYRRKFSNLLRDVLTVDGSPFKSDPIDHDGVHYLRSLALPKGRQFSKGSIRYDLKVAPQAYFERLFVLTGLLEQEERPRLRNLWPLRTELVPRHIRLDTTALAQLLLAPRESAKVLKEVNASKGEVWKRFFHMDRKVWRQGNFHHMLETDGVATTLLFKKEKPSHSKDHETYLDELPVPQRELLRSRKVVSIDPGMADLLSCISETSTVEAPERLRYTQNQRRFDLRTVAHRHHLQYEKNHAVVEGRTITEWETELSAHNHKTVDLEKYCQYLRAKFRFNQAVGPFYTSYHHRKQRFNTFIATQKSERSFLRAFRNRFGAPDELVIAFGDWEQRHHRKYKEPTKGKGFRCMLRREGYEVFLIDEHRTSIQCSRCCENSAQCEPFRRRLDPNTKKPRSQRHVNKVHGLLVCNTCSRLWNRDVNAPLNMNRLARACLEGQARPSYLQRSSRNSTVSHIPSTVQGIVKPVKIQIRW